MDLRHRRWQYVMAVVTADWHRRACSLNGIDHLLAESTCMIYLPNRDVGDGTYVPLSCLNTLYQI